MSNGPRADKTVAGILEAFHRQFHKAEPFQRENVKIDKSLGLEKLSGYYVLTSPRNQLLYPFTELFTEGFFVDNHKGQLSISKLNGKKSKLIQTRSNSFSHSSKKNDYQYVFDISNSSEALYTSLGFSYRKVPFILIAGLTAILIISFLFICLSQISLLMRTVKFLIKKSSSFNPQLTFEIGSSVLLVGCVSYLFVGTLKNLNEPNILSIVLFLCTILFPLFTVLGIIQTIKYKFQYFLDKVWTIGLATSMVIVSSYLMYWDFFGFAIWTF